MELNLSGTQVFPIDTDFVYPYPDAKPVVPMGGDTWAMGLIEDGTPKKYSIGDVSFGRPITDADKAEFRARTGRETTRTWIDAGVGKERVALLRKAYRNELLPDGLFLVSAQACGGNGPITREEVNWDTAGQRVTGK